MAVTSSKTRLLVSSLLLAFLAGCGGGDDNDSGGGLGGQNPGTNPGPNDPGTTVQAADKYVGTWMMPCTSFDVGVFETERFIITKTSANTVNVNFLLTTFNNSTCSGTSTGSETGNATVTIDGQTTVTVNGQPQTADRLTAVVPGDGTFKWTGRVSGTSLIIDFEDNNVESSTVYPTNPNDGTTTYTKQ